MAALNGPASFGWVSRLLHWGMAAGLIAALFLGLWAARAAPGLSTLWLFSWHKSLGMALLAAAVTRALWHRVSPPPGPVEDGMTGWQLALGALVHRLFYVLMPALPLVGWVASAATGPDVVVFGLGLPRIAPTSEALAAGGFALHRWLGYALIAALALHVTGALHRAVLHRDGSLRRILLGR